MKRVAIQADDFDISAELAALEALGGGGVASFTGIVRGEEGLVALELEHYPAMTQRQAERIAAGAVDHPSPWSVAAGRADRVRRHGITASRGGAR